MKVLIYDAIEDSYLGALWAIGAFLLGWYFDAVIAAEDWEEALEGLLQKSTEKNLYVAEVQVWGHGLPGRPLISGQAMPTDDYRVTLAKRWWFRSCGVFSGVIGHEFASSFSLRGMEVAGHTTVMGRWGLHPHLYALRAQQLPSWPTKRADDYDKPSLISPRTILALRMSLPNWAFEEEKTDVSSTS